MRCLILILLTVAVRVSNCHQLESHIEVVESVEPIHGKITYLGNTGLLVSHGDLQVLFDPFFHNHYNNYQLVPDEIRAVIFAKEPPYESVEMIFISHAHGDHFDAKDVVAFLQLNPQTKLVAPRQAVDQLQAIDGVSQVLNQIDGIDLVYGDAPLEKNFGEITIGIVRIPHAGWPGRADVSNLVYRVTLDEEFTVMHMGDADPNDVHFKPWAGYWKQQVTNNAFPPYWFLTTPAGNQILSDRINAIHATGVHVPVVIPKKLQSSGADYFSQPGQVIMLNSGLEYSHNESPSN